MELTDGGPGVGVNSVEVKFRDAEIAFKILTDVVEYIVQQMILIRIKLNRNAGIGEVFVDYEQCHDLHEEDIKKMPAKSWSR